MHTELLSSDHICCPRFFSSSLSLFFSFLSFSFSFPFFFPSLADKHTNYSLFLLLCLTTLSLCFFHGTHLHFYPFTLSHTSSIALWHPPPPIYIHSGRLGGYLCIYALSFFDNYINYYCYFLCYITTFFHKDLITAKTFMSINLTSSFQLYYYHNYIITVTNIIVFIVIATILF